VYRNVIYDAKNELCKLFTWDKSGERVCYDMSFNPYVFYETNGKSNGTSIFNTAVKKRSFKTQYDRYKFVKDCGVTRVFENIPSEQQFLIDQFWEHNESKEFTQHPLKIHFIDIETYSPDTFPDVENPTHPINVITVYDSIHNKFFSWGTKAYETTNIGTNNSKINKQDIVYYHCQTEVEMLRRYIEYTKRDYPDVITGWNSELFDIPYIVCRMGRVLDEDEYKQLSPVGEVFCREIAGQFGKSRYRWYIKGVASLDYLDIYKKFSMGLRPNYKLDTIAEIELGDKKIDYGGINLATLADQDWKTFVDYNIQDVNLLVQMEEKLQYLKLLRMLAYVGLSPLESAMGTLTVITGASVIQARKDGYVIPTFVKEINKDGKYEGAYVGEPERGFQQDIVSFDANSLYPSTMITLNLSPETKVGTIVEKNDTHVVVKHVNGKIFKLTHEKFLKFVKKDRITITKAKALFSQKTKGIIPKIVDTLYSQRVEFKKELDKTRRQLSKLNKTDPGYRDKKLESETWWVKQYTVKILINSIYGYFGNKYAPLGDSDIARSITLTGQAVIKQSNKILYDYVKKLTDNENLRLEDIIKYNDTDSSYISIKPINDHFGNKLCNDKGKVSNETYETVQSIEDHLNEEITTWAKRTLNSEDPRFVFKRECIADVGMFLEKKRYVLHVLDDEGIQVNKFKYTGVEVVRTTLPEPVKPYIKKIIETMMLGQNLGETNKILHETYDIFKDLPVEDIAFAMGCKEYDKYASRCHEFNTCKGMPIHVKASYIHNKILEKLNIEHKYETIGSGDKVRYFYVQQPNRYGINAIGYKYYYPDEFKELFKIDRELMFDKIVYSIIERFYDSVKWKAKKPGMAVQTDLFDLLAV